MRSGGSTRARARAIDGCIEPKAPGELLFELFRLGLSNTSRLLTRDLVNFPPCRRAAKKISPLEIIIIGNYYFGIAFARRFCIQVFSFMPLHLLAAASVPLICVCARALWSSAMMQNLQGSHWIFEPRIQWPGSLTSRAKMSGHFWPNDAHKQSQFGRASCTRAIQMK